MQKIKFIAVVLFLTLACAANAKESLKLKTKKSTVQTADVQGADDETAVYTGK